MATPMVSGAAALLSQQNPNLSPDLIKARLMKTAYKNLVQYTSVTDPTTGITYYEQADIFTVGAGYLGVWAALNNTDLTLSTASSAQSPTAAYNSTTGQVTLVNRTSVIWGSSCDLGQLGCVGLLGDLGQQHSGPVGHLGQLRHLGL